MKKTLVAALLAASTLSFAIVPAAQANPLNLLARLLGGQECHRPYVMYEGRCVLPPRHEQEGPMVLEEGYPPTEDQPIVEEHRRPEHECLPGYDYYVGKGECIETHAPKLVQKVRCKLGEFRQVPDPSRPGGFRIQECRSLNRNLD